MKSLLRTVLFAAPAALMVGGCAGSGTGTGNNGGGGGGGGNNLPTSYNTPVKGNFDGSVDTLTAINQLNQFVGSLPPDVTGAYWSSPTATPKTLAAPATGGHLWEPMSINDHAEMAGFTAAGQPSQNQYKPLYWSGPTGAATPLAMQSGVTYGYASWINNSHALVGWQLVNNVVTATYWSSPTATGVALSGGANFRGYRINNNGVIVGNSVQQSQAVVWTSPTSAPKALPGSGANTDVFVSGINDNGTVCGNVSNPTGNTYFPAVWTPPNYQITLLKGPASNANGAAISINNLGEVVGITNVPGTGNATEATLWTSASANALLFQNIIPSGFNGQLQNGYYILNNSDVLVLGQAPNATGQEYTAYFLTPKT